MINMKYDIKFLRSISINVILKPVSLLISLAYTPLLLKFLGDEQYGIWSTLLSILNWITIFDFGIAGGYRNILSIKLSSRDYAETRKVTSTAYFFLGGVVLGIFLILVSLASVLNWKSIFKTSLNCKMAIFISIFFVCANFIFGLTNAVFYASQKSHMVPVINVLIQSLNLVSIIMLNKMWKSDGNRITPLSVLYCSMSLIVNITVLYYIWRRSYYFKPKFNLVRKKYIKPIFNYGWKLFFLQISGIILFSSDNMIITQLFSPTEVTPYSIVYSSFNAFNGIFSAMLAPFWSKYTVENYNGNYKWIKKSIVYQLFLWLLILIVMFIIGGKMKLIYLLWLGRDLNVSNELIYAMIFLMATGMFTNIFSNFLNGVSHVNLQVVISVIAAIINVPLSFFLAKNMDLGVIGVCISTIICQLLGCVLLPIDTMRFIKRGNEKSGKD